MLLRAVFLSQVHMNALAIFWSWSSSQPLCFWPFDYILIYTQWLLTTHLRIQMFVKRNLINGFPFNSHYVLNSTHFHNHIPLQISCLLLYFKCTPRYTNIDARHINPPLVGAMSYFGVWSTAESVIWVKKILPSELRWLMWCFFSKYDRLNCILAVLACNRDQ